MVVVAPQGAGRAKHWGDAAVSKPFCCGLVVGKFCPLHRGHETVIERALSTCDEVLIINYTQPEFEHCDRATRERWLTQGFPNATTLVIDNAHLAQLCQRLGFADAPTLPHNDAPDDDHRLFVAWLCRFILGKTVDAVFTSETYGDGFAQVLTAQFQQIVPNAPPVKHVCIDPGRSAVPISGTRVRLSPHENRQFLSPAVYASFVERVCILGGESSGKTTLAQALAQHHGSVWVPEYGRELWERKNGQLVLSDMLEIGRQQWQREEELACAANRFLFCDTSALTTLFYSQAMFGSVAPELTSLAQRHYAHVMLCAPDFDFVQDGTRRDAAFRDQQHAWYVQELASRSILYTLLTGTVAQRLQQAQSCLKRGKAQ